MNITQLKYFEAVCTFQSVSDAAEYLHISQPSLSSAIKDLEKEFAVLLFRRHHHGMELTSEGEMLRRLSRDILKRAEQTESIMKDLGGERKKLRLGVPPMIGSIFLPQIYRSFSADNPDITIEISEGGRQELVQKLSDDYLDMVFLPHNRPIEKGFSSVKISSFEIVCCVSKNSEISHYKFVNPRILENRPVVLFENSFFQTEEIKKWFMSEKVSPDILLQTEQLSTMLSIVSNNIAAGFMFRQLIENNSELVAVSLEKPICADVSLVWKSNTFFLKCMTRFKECITKSNLLDNWRNI